MKLNDYTYVVTGAAFGPGAATHMIRQRQGGVIINISSISGAGNAGKSNYAAAKARVAASKPEAQERLASMISLGRLGKPVELADTVRFIGENDYVNSCIIELDGGLRS